MTTLRVTLTDLTFPGNLKDAFCKFRPLISISYRDSNNKFMTAREAIPGLGSRDYYECEKDNKNKPDFVRHPTEPKVDIGKVGISQRRVSFNEVDVKKLETIEVEIFDIDIKTGLEKIKDTILKELQKQLPNLVLPALPLSLTIIKGAVEKASGKQLPDLEKSLIDKAIGKADGAARSLWDQEKELTDEPNQTVTIDGGSSHGEFSVTLKIELL